MPVTIPVTPIVAMPVATLLHTPPGAASESVVARPRHTLAVPVMKPALGNGLTVTTWVETAVPQAFVTVYEMVVVPADTPVTIPAAFIVALAGVEELHTPPPTLLLKVVVVAAQTVAVPVIVPALGSRLTVKITDVAAVPQLFVTV